jgi:hypothetical protein
MVENELNALIFSDFCDFYVFKRENVLKIKSFQCKNKISSQKNG